MFRTLRLSSADRFSARRRSVRPAGRRIARLRVEELDARVVPTLNWGTTALDLFGTDLGAAVTPNGNFFASDGFDIDRSTNQGATWATVTGFATFAGGAIAYDPADPTVMIAGRGHGTVKSVDGGANWFNLVDLNAGPPAHAITFDPSDPQTVYAGVGVGWGVYKSVNGGSNWTNVLTNRDVYAVAVDPSNPQTVFAGASNYTSYLPGVLKSTNGGSTWATVLPGKIVRSLVIDPADPQRVFAGTYDDGVYETGNGGASWTKVSGSAIVASVSELVLDPRDSSQIYAATAGQGIFHSLDGGVTWVPDNTGLTDLNVVAMDVQTQYPYRVLAVTYGGNGFKAVAPPMPPTVNLAQPADGGVYSRAAWPDAVSGSASVRAATVTAVSVSIQAPTGKYWDGSGFSSVAEVLLPATGTDTWSLPFPDGNFPADGTYSLRIVATDSNGVANDPTYAFFTFDTTPPDVTVVPQAVSDPTPTVTGSVTDGSLTVQLNGKTYTPGDGHLTVTGSVWTLDVPPTDALPDGTFDVTAAAADGVGNVGTDPTAAELVIDTTPPAAAAFNPADDVTGVPADANLVLTLSESVVKGGGDILIRRASDNAVVDTIPVAGGGVAVSGPTVTINPAATLAGLTDYFIEVPAGAFVDAVGNPFGGLTDPTEWNFTTVRLNSAPVLDPAAGPLLTTILRGDSKPAGDRLDAFAAAGISDIDPGDRLGIAVVGLTGAGQGTWQCSLDAGGTWAAFGTVGEGSARLLSDADRVRFVPAVGFAGTAGLTYRAWDRTTGAVGGTADLSVAGATGGTTAFSSATTTATIHVAVTLTPVPEDSRKPKGDSVGSLLAGHLIDPDAGARTGLAVVGVTGADHGAWQFSTNGGRSWKPLGAVGPAAARLLRDVDWIRFVPAADYTGTASLRFRAWDQSAGTAGGTADLTSAVATAAGSAFSGSDSELFVRVTPVNDAPVLDPGGDPPLTAVAPTETDPAGDLVAAVLGSAATDVDADAVGMAVTGGTGPGTWQVSVAGGGWSGLGTVSATSARLLGPADRIRFVPNPGASGSAGLAFRAWDGSSGVPGGVAKPTGTAFSKGKETAVLLITANPPAATNTAPALRAGGAPTLTAVVEDSKPAGDSVGDVLGTGVTDPDVGARRGIAVTGLTGTANGSWQFSTNGGRVWKTIGGSADANALLLRDTDRIRFLPARDFNGSATLTYRAWDQTRGTAGARTDLTAAAAAGGSGPFSIAATTVGVTVLPANDRPTLPTRFSALLTPVSPGAADPPGDTIAGLLAGRAFDVDGDGVGIAVTAASGPGAWEFQSSGATGWSPLAAVSAGGARLLGPADRIRFVPAPGPGGTAKLAFKGWDGFVGVGGDVADSAVGSAFSTTSGSAALVVNGTDDAPVLPAGTRISLTPVTAGSIDPTGDLVSALLAGRATDADPGAELGLAVTAVAPAAGTWQVSISGGAWEDLGPVSTRVPRLLRAVDRLRFVPASGFAGTAGLSFKVWDAASLAPAGPGAFSKNAGTAVVVVNTSPVLDI